MSEQQGIFVAIILSELGVILLALTLLSIARCQLRGERETSSSLRRVNDEIRQRHISSQRAETVATRKADRLERQIDSLRVDDLRVGHGSFVAYGQECRIVEVAHDFERGWTLSAVGITSLHRKGDEA